MVPSVVPVHANLAEAALPSWQNAPEFAHLAAHALSLLEVSCS